MNRTDHTIRDASEIKMQSLFTWIESFGNDYPLLAQPL